MVDPVEELLQVHVHHHPAACLHVLLRLQHRVVRATPRPEAVAVLAEGRINQRLQHLQQGLLDQPSTTVGIPSSRIPPPGLGMPTRRTGSGR